MFSMLKQKDVLILVLVEDGLGGTQTQIFGAEEGVLILVLVEDGLGVLEKLPEETKLIRLNPCFSGGWSRRHTIYTIVS